MNKETIYIEAGDDITDILSHLKATDKKIIALVPPKKTNGILASSVNIKLIARLARSEKKAVVLVTTDDSLTKLAMSAKLPVAPSLKSRPVIPDGANFAELTTESESKDNKQDKESAKEDKSAASKESVKTASEEFVSEPEPSKIVSSSEKDSKKDVEKADEDIDPEELLDKESRDDKDDEDDDKEDTKDSKSKQDKKSKKDKKSSKDEPKPWLKQHMLWIILGSVFLVGMVFFLIWAFTIAPSVNIAISIRTSSGNFSQSVVLTKNSSDENPSSGTFYTHEEKLEKEQVVKFTATGKKDIGEKAHGKIGIYTTITGVGESGGSVTIPEGSTFRYGELEYASTQATTLSWNGKDTSVCGNIDKDLDAISAALKLIKDGCRISGVLTVEAVGPGESFNLEDKNSGWTSGVNGVVVTGSDPISGGSSKVVTVVQQSDVDTALEKLTSESSSENKAELLSSLSDTVMPIEASFKVNASDPTVSPEVGKEVSDGVTPSVSTKTVYTILTIDSANVEEFISARASLDDGEKLYSIGSPFIEYFNQTDDKTYTGKLKTTYRYGPKISETEVLEKVQGEKIGRVEPILIDSFPGISKPIHIQKSYFWVSAVPSDPNKIKITIDIEK